MVDDSHAVGFMGATGRGTPEHCGVAGRVDILTGTLGKALGGASGGYVAARREIVELAAAALAALPVLQQLPPVIAAASLAVLDLLEHTPRAARAAARQRALLPRAACTRAGFTLKPGEHPIIPVMLGDAALAEPHGRRAARATASTSSASPIPVVPKGQARIRTQMSRGAHPRAARARDRRLRATSAAQLGVS